MKDNQDIQAFFDGMPSTEPPAFEIMWTEVTHKHQKVHRKKLMIGLSTMVTILLIIGWIGWSQYELYQAKKAAQMEFAESWQLPTDGFLMRTSVQKESILNWESPTGQLMEDW